ncbi:MAG: nucleotidyl transferase AbiEii/AbiGii toxin family protein [Kiritimatiellaeota bacterium]|nr:nucleotidyl transferase AbiEii/AbiGii toxin family protein [Kiritimatiellota bacterium]
MHEKVLPKHSLELLNRLGAQPSERLRGWTLAGGTGLAFRLGHRVSDDLDFFRTDRMDVRCLHEELARQGPYETLQEAEHTLTAIIRGTKLSFFRVRDPFLFPATPCRFFAVADLRDIALMKLATISGRGSCRDFIDLYMILRDDPPLRVYLDLLPRKYGASRINAYHILKSLTYFDDAETEPLPRMRVPFSWKECKAFFVREAQALVLP